MIAADGDICREFIHLAADGELVGVGAFVGDERKTIFAGLHDC